MTTVNFDLSDEIAAAGLDAADGQLLCRYAQDFVVGDVVVTANPFIVEIVAGVGDADMYPTPIGNGLLVRAVAGSGLRGVRARMVAVPDSPTPVEFTDLTELDPGTLDPAQDATAAWYAALNDRIPAAGTAGMFLTKGPGSTNAWTDAGAGDVVGPDSSDDNRVARMDGTTGKKIQQSPVSIDDDGAMTGMTTVDGRDVSVDGGKLDGIATGATANSTDAQLRDRSTHTGTQDADTIDGLADVATSGDYADLTNTPSALPPSGGAGGVLSGSYPNPGFAVDMATQAELDAEKAMARDAANLNSGTIPDGRIGSNITRDSELAPVATSGSASDLTTGTLPTSVLPALAITEPFVVASQAAMLALSAQKGDVAIRTDNGKSYILSTNSPGTLADWIEITAAGAVTSVNGETGNVVLNQDEVADGTTAKQFTATEKTKLAGVATGATANSTDAQLRDRATHTGTQPAGTITGLAAVATSGDYDDLTDKPTALPPNGAAGGVLGGTYPNPTFADSDVTALAGLDSSTAGTIASDGSGWIKKTYAQLKTALALVVGDVSGAAPLASPALTGNPTVPTQTPGTNNTRAASTAYADAAVAVEATARDAAMLARARVQPSTVALLGDSLSSPTFIGGGVGTYDAAANPSYAHSQGYWTWANILLGQKMQLVYTGGVAGNTTTQVLARVTDITGLAVLPGYCVVEAGVNDILNDVAVATVISNLTGIYDALRAKGITVVACTAEPVWTATDARRKRQEDINNWIRDYATTQPGMILCDWAGPWTNASDGAARTGYDDSGGVHPSVVGAGVLGKVLADTLRPYLPGGPPALASNNVDGSAIVNPMMLGTAGGFGAGISGSLADSWLAGRFAGSGTLAMSKVARADGISGEWQKIDIAGGGGYFLMYQDVSTGLPTAGEKWFAELEFDAADLSAMTQFVLYLTATGTTNASAYSPFTGGAWAFPVSADVSAGVLRTPPITIPAGLSNLQTGLIIQGTAGSARVSRIRSRKAGV